MKKNEATRILSALIRQINETKDFSTEFGLERTWSKEFLLINIYQVNYAQWDLYDIRRVVKMFDKVGIKDADCCGWLEIIDNKIQFSYTIWYDKEERE